MTVLGSLSEIYSVFIFWDKFYFVPNFSPTLRDYLYSNKTLKFLLWREYKIKNPFILISLSFSFLCVMHWRGNSCARCELLNFYYLFWNIYMWLRKSSFYQIYKTILNHCYCSIRNGGGDYNKNWFSNFHILMGR